MPDALCRADVLASPACGVETRKLALRSDASKAIRPVSLDERLYAPQPSPASAGEWIVQSIRGFYAASNAGTGNAVTDLIFSIANREVTFFSATALISFL